ncbi:MAG: YitT family protein [Clostridiales Family XIII bacterium]|nr:YitT family protein [Clostridiales Family XIII bacterium]
MAECDAEYSGGVCVGGVNRCSKREVEQLKKIKRFFAGLGQKFGKHKKIWTPISQILFLLFGNVCYVLAVQLFFAGNNIAAGGFAGIATVINYIVPISIGNLVLLMNIPLIIVSFFVFGWKYSLKILLAITTYAGLFQLVHTLPLATDDRFAACIFGGVLYAIGAVFILYARTSAGGTDLVARLLLRKFKHLSLGKMFLCVDGCVVIFAVIVYRNIESGVYAIAAIFVCSFLTDHIISGFDNADICYIVTVLDPMPMSKAIMEELEVGVTQQDATGMYSGETKHMLMVVVRPREIHHLKRIVTDHDPNAFVVIAWANEVRGGGFDNMSEIFK